MPKLSERQQRERFIARILKCSKCFTGGHCNKSIHMLSIKYCVKIGFLVPIQERPPEQWRFGGRFFILVDADAAGDNAGGFAADILDGEALHVDDEVAALLRGYREVLGEVVGADEFILGVVEG